MMEAVFVQRVLVSILTTVGSIAVPGIYTPIVHDDSSGIGSFVLPCTGRTLHKQTQAHRAPGICAAGSQLG